LPAQSIQTVNQGTQVLISWDYPDDSADTIIQYSIQIRQSDGLTFTETVECDGSNTLVVSSRSCLVNLSTLRAAPYSLAFDDYIVASIASMNSFGWSIYSQPNTGGAKIWTEPQQMLIPVYLPLQSDGYSMTIQLSALSSYTETGGSVVDSYHL
jgi:hypothetical protein